MSAGNPAAVGTATTRRLSRTLVFGAISALLVAGCGKPAEKADGAAEQASAPAGRPGPAALAPGGSPPAQMPVTEGPSGLRPDAPEDARQVLNSDGGEIDRVAAMAVADVEEFWTGAYGPPLKGEFFPVKSLFSWDSNDMSSKGSFCGLGTAEFPNAAWCGSEKGENCAPDGTCWSAYDTIGWDRGNLFPEIQRELGDGAVAFVLGHEYGHAIQYFRADLELPNGLVAEQQADCLAGVYLRWVTDGNSPRFTLNTGDGLNKVMAAIIGVRDPVVTINDPVQRVGLREGHGSAFERISAFQMGYEEGSAVCVGIDDEEIVERRGDLPVALQEGTSGENPVSEESVRMVVDALNEVFEPSDPPALSFEPEACEGSRPGTPASYCPSNNTIVVDLPELQGMSTSFSRQMGIKTTTLPQFGDYTAYSVLASRYTQSLQEQRGGVSLDDSEAGLRTACLTGLATAKLSSPVAVAGDQTIALTAGDLDEAVAGLLDNGMAASDVNGKPAPSGFARVDAFRSGVLGSEDGCFDAFQ